MFGVAIMTMAARLGCTGMPLLSNGLDPVEWVRRYPTRNLPHDYEAALTLGGHVWSWVGQFNARNDTQTNETLTVVMLRLLERQQPIVLAHDNFPTLEACTALMGILVQEGIQNLPSTVQLRDPAWLLNPNHWQFETWVKNKVKALKTDNVRDILKKIPTPHDAYWAELHDRVSSRIRRGTTLKAFKSFVMKAIHLAGKQAVSQYERDALRNQQMVSVDPDTFGANVDYADPDAPNSPEYWAHVGMSLRYQGVQKVLESLDPEAREYFKVALATLESKNQMPSNTSLRGPEGAIPTLRGLSPNELASRREQYTKALRYALEDDMEYDVPLVKPKKKSSSPPSVFT